MIKDDIEEEIYAHRFRTGGKIRECGHGRFAGIALAVERRHLPHVLNGIRAARSARFINARVIADRMDGLNPQRVHSEVREIAEVCRLGRIEEVLECAARAEIVAGRVDDISLKLIENNVARFLRRNHHRGVADARPTPIRIAGHFISAGQPVCARLVDRERNPPFAAFPLRHGKADEIVGALGGRARHAGPILIAQRRAITAIQVAPDLGLLHVPLVGPEVHVEDFRIVRLIDVIGQGSIIRVRAVYRHVRRGQQA